MGIDWNSVMRGAAMNSVSSMAPYVMTGSQRQVNGDRNEFYTYGA